MKKVLVLCTGNSCRSQMAEGFLRKYAGENAQIFSAGVETHGLNPRAVQVMREAGIDISGHSSDHVNQYLGTGIGWVITVCDSAAEKCPYFPEQTILSHHSFPDPAKATGTEAEILDAFRAVRDEIDVFAEKWVKENLG